MPRAEAGSSKAIGNAMKSKGLQKLRWYCQVCEKQCRDENGFKCHTMSENHLRQMLVVGESAGKHIEGYSSQFQSEFVAMLSRRWGTKRVRINQVYQEYIHDKSHLHMNATRWLSLTEFCKHLGRSGQAVVDETEKGWFISWIDNSPKALAKAEQNQKKERGDVDDETRQRKLIEEQIERARKDGERRRVEAAGGVWDGTSATLEVDPEKQELKREEGEKVSLSLSFKTKATPEVIDPATPSTGPSVKSEHDDASGALSAAAPLAVSLPIAPIITKSTFILPPSKPSIAFIAKPNAFRSNPLKGKPNPVKPSASSTSSLGVKRAAPLSNVEMIVQEEMARKNRLSAGGSEAKRPRY